MNKKEFETAMTAAGFKASVSFNGWDRSDFPAKRMYLVSVESDGKFASYINETNLERVASNYGVFNF